MSSITRSSGDHLRNRKAWWIVFAILMFALIATSVSCRPLRHRKDWPRATDGPQPAHQVPGESPGPSS